jgi:hypothetical protein
MLLRPLRWLLLERFLRLVPKFFNSPLSPVTSTTRIASSTIPPPTYLRETLGQSWRLPHCMATLWSCTNAPTFTNFKRLILPLLSVLSQRFPRPFWHGDVAFFLKQATWHLQPLISLLQSLIRLFLWPLWPVTSGS